MSARDDYPILDGLTARAFQHREMCDEIDRYRAELEGLAVALVARHAECKAWMNGVADVVEPYGFDREAACGPSDLLPGLKTLAEFAFKAMPPAALHACDTPDCPAITYRCAESRTP